MSANKNEYCATERLYLNSAGQAVGADDPDRQSLLLGVGACMPLEKARQYGLVDADGNAVERNKQPEEKAVTRAPANKAVLSVPQNKGNTRK